MASDVEVIEFKSPGQSSCLFLSPVTAPTSTPFEQVSVTLHEYFSQYGLVYKTNLFQDEDTKEYYCYIYFYSMRAASAARIASRGTANSLFMIQYMLSRAQCEQLANYYLGFNGWSSTVQYHRHEEQDDNQIKVVSIATINFPKHNISCEGAGMFDGEIVGMNNKAQLIAEVGKRARAHAIIKAWTKVVLIIVGGNKVSVEINTTKTDNFFYEPLWDEPVVTVKEADYKDEYIDDHDNKNN